MSPRVGAVIRTLNSAQYLPDAIKSVVDQLPRPDDVVVVDGGSTDGTLEVIARFAPLVRLVRQRRPGLGGAAEDGVQALDCDVVAFQDSDDLWPDGRLGRLLEALTAHPDWGAVMGRVEHFISPDLPEETRGRFNIPEGLKPGVGLPSFMAHRWVFEQAGPFMEGIMAGEYLEWMDRVKRAGIAIGHVDILSLRRRVHGLNTTGNPSTKTDYLRALRATIVRGRGQTQEDSGQSHVP